MIDLKNKYIQAKTKAKSLMQAGNVSAYIAQLAVVQHLQLQLFNSSLKNIR
jgi:hypothetical protein